MEQKLIRVYRDNTDELDSYLNKGWAVSQISAAACAGSTTIHSYCYVVITKGAQHLKTDE